MARYFDTNPGVDYEMIEATAFDTYDNAKFISIIALKQPGNYEHVQGAIDFVAISRERLLYLRLAIARLDLSGETRLELFETLMDYDYKLMPLEGSLNAASLERILTPEPENLLT